MTQIITKYPKQGRYNETTKNEPNIKKIAQNGPNNNGTAQNETYISKTSQL